MKRSMNGIALAIVGFFLGAASLLALDPARAVTEYGRSFWQDDLPQNTVHTIVQSRDGYVWMGTYEGLVRFDGVRLTIYNMRNTPAIRNNGVLALFEDRRGDLWVGTDGGGISVLRRGVFETVTTPEKFSRNRIHAIAQDARGAMWFATTQGLSRYADGKLTSLDASDGIPAGEARALAASPDGGLWAGLESGWLCRIDGAGVHTLGVKDGLPAAAIRSLHPAPDGTLWVGTDGAGIVRMRDGRVVDAITTANGLTSNFIRRVLTDRHGNVWIATNGGGINRYYRGTITHLTTAEGLPSDLARTLCEDREGSLWIGTNGGGAIQLRDDKFVTYGAREGIAGENVRAVTQDRDGALWIGTDGGGLFRMRSGAIERFPGQAALGSLFIRALLVDRRGDLWVGTVGRGAARIHAGKVVQSVAAAEGLSSLSVSSIFEDTRGRIWIATADRNLHVLENGVMTTAATAPGKPVAIVGNILEDRKGRLWFCSDVGLYLLDGNGWRHFTTADGLPDNLVFSAYEDGEGALWIGTTRGLSRYRDGRFTNYSVDDGLADDVAFSILEDRQGYLWMTSNRGINRVKRTDFAAFDEKRIASLHSQLFDRNDGLRSSQCNGHTQPAAWRTVDGRLWFGTVRGISVIDPANIKFNAVAPPTKIEKVIVDGRPLHPGGQLSLAADDQKLEIEYTALSFMAPSRVNFRFRLEGYDRRWVEAGTRRAAYYNNLPPGSYRFVVQASNNDGVWTQTGSAFAIEVATPLWLRWWALLLYLAGAGALVYLIVRWRMAALHARAAMLEERVAERTAEIAEKVEQLERSEARAKEASEAKGRFLAHMSHELRTPLNAILGFVQLMERTPGRSGEDREALSVITRSGRHLLALINDVLSMATIEAGRHVRNEAAFDLRRLVADVESLFRARAEESALAFEVTLGSGIPRYVTGDEGKIRQVLVNLLGNAFKFTAEGQVSLEVEPAGDAIRFAVSDSGPGLTADEIAVLTQPFVQTASGRRMKEGTGLGLSICRSFVELMGGELQIDSEPGRGSSFWFELPLPAVASAAEHDQRRVVALEPSSKVPRILVAEDNAVSRMFLVRILRSVGFEVDEAADGSEAVAAWERGAPDLVLMDIQMPEVDGDEAAATIRLEERTVGRRRTVLVALTASAFDHERNRLLALGFDDYIAKPFLAATVFESVARHLGVRYRYEEVQQPQRARVAEIDAAALASLDRAWLDALSNAVDGGDVEGATKLVDGIAAEHERLATAVRNLIRAYRFDELLKAIEQARSEQGARL